MEREKERETQRQSERKRGEWGRETWKKKRGNMRREREVKGELGGGGGGRGRQRHKGGNWGEREK